MFGVVGLGSLIGARYLIALKLDTALREGAIAAPRAVTIGNAELLSRLPEI